MLPPQSRKPYEPGELIVGALDYYETEDHEVRECGNARYHHSKNLPVKRPEAEASQSRHNQNQTGETGKKLGA